MTVFKDFLQWYNNKDVVPTLEAMQKMIQFYHNKGIDMLKLGCTLPNLANICLHKSTNDKFYPFCESDKVFQMSFLYKEQRGDGLSCCEEAGSTKLKAVDSLSFL